MDRPEAASKPVEHARGTRAHSHGSSPSPPPDGGSEGRPAATPAETPRYRSIHLSVRLYPEELERIQFAARARGLATSTFVRAASLGESLPAVRTSQEKRDAAALLIRALPLFQTVAAGLGLEGHSEMAGHLTAGVALVHEALGSLTS